MSKLVDSILECWQIVELEETLPQAPEECEQLRHGEGEAQGPDPGHL